MNYDVVIVGAGPAGLSAAINGASEGLRVALIDSAQKLGGQARESACVENYPLPFGSHNGVSGSDLMMGFTAQAEKFCTTITCPTAAARLVIDGKDKVIITENFDEYRAPAVILSMGLSYRRLAADGIARLMGRGVYYGMNAATSYAGKRVAVIGGANSAGQAAVRLAEHPDTSVLVIARSAIKDQMSSYLVDRLNAAKNVTILEDAQVKRVGGTRSLEAIMVQQAGNMVEKPVDEMFIFIGAVPHTAWLPQDVRIDPKRYVLTDIDAGAALPCETTVSGIFAAGDIRHGQGVKRITGATFDGVCAVQSVHRYLAGAK